MTCPSQRRLGRQDVTVQLDLVDRRQLGPGVARVRRMDLHGHERRRERPQGRQHMSGGDLLDALTAVETEVETPPPAPEPTPSKPGGLLMRYLKGED